MGIIKLNPNKPDIYYGDENLQLHIHQEFTILNPENLEAVEGLKSWELKIRTIEENHDWRQFAKSNEVEVISLDFSIDGRDFKGLGVVVSFHTIEKCNHCGYAEFEYLIQGTDKLDD